MGNNSASTISPSLKQKDESEIKKLFDNNDRNDDGYLNYKEFSKLGETVWFKYKKNLNEKEKHELYYVIGFMKRIEDIFNKKNKLEISEAACDKLLIDVYVCELFKVYDKEKQQMVGYEDFLKFVSDQINNTEMLKANSDVSMLKFAMYQPNNVRMKNVFCHYDLTGDMKLNKYELSKLIKDLCKVKSMEPKAKINRVISGFLKNFDSNNSIYINSHQCIELLGYEAYDFLNKEKREMLKKSWRNFDRILESDYGKSYYRDFLTLEYCEENMDFIIAMGNLKQNYSLELALQIYQHYIRGQILPLPHSIYSKVDACVSQNKLIFSTFDESVLAVTNVLRSDSFVRFVESPYFISFVKYAYAKSIIL